MLAPYGKTHLCIVPPCPPTTGVGFPSGGFTRPYAPAGLTKIAKAPSGAGIPRDPGAGINFEGIARGVEKTAIAAAANYYANNPKEKPKGFDPYAREKLQLPPLPPVVNPDPTSFGGGISPMEMAEIDAAIDEQLARAERIEQLGRYVGTLPRGQIMDRAVAIAEAPVSAKPKEKPAPISTVVPQLRGKKRKKPDPKPPPPKAKVVPIRPAPVVKPHPIERTQPVVLSDPPTGPTKPDPAGTTDEESGMNLSDILGGITQVAKTYAGVKQIIDPPKIQYVPAPPTQPAPTNTFRWGFPPPAPTPAPQVPSGGSTWVGYQPAFFDDGIFSGGAWDAITDYFDTTEVTTLNAPNPYCLTKKQIAAAQAAGMSPEQAALFAKASRSRRRRRRMLTKSDVADISTMAALLGKGSEAFKTWLAGANRR